MEFAGQSPLPPRAVPQLDEFAERAARLLDAPVAMVSLVDVHGQNLPGAFGLPEPWATERWTPLTHSFCQHVVASRKPLTVTNANDDARVSDNGAVMDLGVIAYLGVPLAIGRGRNRVAGALCAIDHTPREWSPEQLAELERLAAECARELAAMVQQQVPRSG